MNNSQITISKLSRPSIYNRKYIRPSVIAVVVIIIALLPLLIKSEYSLHIIILTFIYLIAAVSLRTIVISGQFPLAHGAFMGIGAYAAGMASIHLDWSPWLTIPVAALVTMGIGILIGHPFARLRALYYAMGSLFFGIGVTQIFCAGGKWTGGYNGLTGVHQIFVGSRLPYYYFFFGLFLVSAIFLYRFEFSRIGMNLKAIAQSYLSASSVGINEAWYRTMVLGVGCFFVGLAGAAYAHYNQTITPNAFNLMATLWLVMYVLIGGTGSFFGPIIGTAILVIIPELVRGLKIYSPYVSAAILLIIVYLLPNGIVSLPQVIISLYKDKKLRKKMPNVS